MGWAWLKNRAEDGGVGKGLAPRASGTNINPSTPSLQPWGFVRPSTQSSIFIPTGRVCVLYEQVEYRLILAIGSVPGSVKTIRKHRATARNHKQIFRSNISPQISSFQTGLYVDLGAIDLSGSDDICNELKETMTLHCGGCGLQVAGSPALWSAVFSNPSNQRQRGSPFCLSELGTSRARRQHISIREKTSADFIPRRWLLAN